MAGTLEGGRKAKFTNIKKYGLDFYIKIGAQGGKASKGGGFAYMAIHQPDKLRAVSVKGGTISSRLGVKSRRKDENTR